MNPAPPVTSKFMGQGHTTVCRLLFAPKDGDEAAVAVAQREPVVDRTGHDQSARKSGTDLSWRAPGKASVAGQGCRSLCNRGDDARARSGTRRPVRLSWRPLAVATSGRDPPPPGAPRAPPPAVAVADAAGRR